MNREQFQDDMQIYRRWRHCLLWRSVFIFAVGPLVLTVLGTVACWLGMINAPLNTALAYQFMVAFSVAFGLLFWAKSPLDLRSRIRRFLAMDLLD